MNCLNNLRATSKLTFSSSSWRISSFLCEPCRQKYHKTQKRCEFHPVSLGERQIATDLSYNIRLVQSRCNGILLHLARTRSSLRARKIYISHAV